jgi:hypothetical protein
MARHIHATASRPGVAARWALLAALWAVGLVAGFYAMLGAGAKLGCGKSAHGLACRPAGSALGVAIVLGVIVIVTAATIALQDAATRGSRALRLLSGLVLLGACLLGARALLATA